MQPVGDPHGHVGEAVQLLKGDPPAVEAAQKDPAALGPQVDGEETGGSTHLSTGCPRTLIRASASCPVSIRECCTTTGTSDSTRTA
ncbi:hypothetical protein RxyAA322_10210 [Rubrobacter xylanophilus]|uniref:Uncharacterized protein n=1 Tax=Rubrobacter xylanophilus TaxID=49319 RepID=A0A510HL96_9ACTN|nr:hypothetical protein RxyAA322_10210 [Rubrobacter xylanophilus]